jgi:hypothetical protein
MNEEVKLSFSDSLPPRRMKMGVFADSIRKFVLILPNRWWFLPFHSCAEVIAFVLQKISILFPSVI